MNRKAVVGSVRAALAAPRQNLERFIFWRNLEPFRPPKHQKKGELAPKKARTMPRHSFFFSYVRFSIKEQTLFAKRMSFLVKAGVPLLESLHLIRNQTKSRNKGRVFDQIIGDVESGQFLSSSLKKFGTLFGDFAINLIRVGESGGILSQNLAYLAEELHKRHLLRKKVISALVYPLFITAATLGITGLLTVFIFPKILPIFASLNVTLPLTTRILITVSNFLRDYGLYMIGLIIVGSIVFFILRRKLEPLRLATDRVILLVPFASAIARNYNLANFSRTLGLLLRSGIHLSEAVAITAETTSNRVYRHAFERVAEAVIKGGTMSAELMRYPKLFPDVMPHMIMIGENTGSLSNTLVYLSELYEAEVDELTKNLSSSIEPVLMIVMGLLVGLIAVSVITPIYEVTQHLNPK